MTPRPGIIAEPSIGQKEHIGYLVAGPVEQRVPVIKLERTLSGIDPGILAEALARLVARHESLRTVFPAINDEIKQEILPYDWSEFKLICIDVCQKDIEFSQVKKLFYDEAIRIFSKVGTGPLFKAYAFMLPDDTCFFSFIIHHIICDAWSLDIIETELTTLYESCLTAAKHQLPPLSIQLRGYCEQQNIWLRDNKELLSTYWADALKEFDYMFDVEPFYRKYAGRKGIAVPEERIVKPVSLDEMTDVLNIPDAAIYSTGINEQIYKKIHEFARKNKYSLSAILYASFHLLIHVYTGKEKVLLAALAADRIPPENENLIGCLLGGLYIPGRISKGQAISGFISQTLSALVENMQRIIFSHELLALDAPQLRVRSDIYINYVSSKKVLEPTGFVYQGEHRPDHDICYALNCIVTEYENGFTIGWRYNKTLFEDRIIEDLAECHGAIIRYMIEYADKTVKELAAIF